MLEIELKAALPNKERLIIGHPGGSFRNSVYYSTDLWFSTKKVTGQEVPRHWNGFGLGKREGGHQIIVVEINPPIAGLTRMVSGLFARDDETRKYYLLHRGRIGGGRKGIGKESFKDWYRGSSMKVYESNGTGDEAILIGPLGTGRLVTPLRTFVREVAQFKDEVVSGSLSRQPSRDATDRAFTPESFGRRKGARSSCMDYESCHGLVVNELEKWSKTHGLVKNGVTTNNQLIDLGIRVNGRLVHIFEVKSAADVQSLYTGIGQLFMHSKGHKRVRKTLVLPRGECSNRVKTILSKLNINLLEYSIQGDHVRFRT
jgi:hypothetical protein